jgi:ABC-type nitrate/sulfonate/bicarbonate transport system permease component
MRLLKSKTLLATISIITLWTVVAISVENIRGVNFPTPMDTISNLKEFLLNRDLYGSPFYAHLTISLYRWGVGYF